MRRKKQSEQIKSEEQIEDEKFSAKFTIVIGVITFILIYIITTAYKEKVICDSLNGVLVTKTFGGFHCIFN